MSNTNTNLQTQTSNALHNAIMEAGGKYHPPMSAPEGSSETTTGRYMENYKNVSQDIRDQLNAKVEAVQIILTGIDNDIYSTVDACQNACEMWKAIERLKQVLTSITTKMAKNKLNEIRSERLARNSNPLALVAQQQPGYHPQNHPNHYTQNSLTKSQQAATGNRGKEIINSPSPTYDQEPKMVAEDDALSKEREIDKLMALISLSFNKIYKPTNNNLRTSSNTSRANQDNNLRINRGTGYDNLMAVNVAGDRENVGTQVDAALTKEKDDTCYSPRGNLDSLNRTKLIEDDTDDEPEDQELEAHYMYMAQIQEVTLDAADNSGPIFDTEPLQKVQNDDADNYNVFANDQEHHVYMSTNGETVDQDDDDLANEGDLLASLIDKLKCEIDDSKNCNKFLESSNKTLVDKLKDLKKFQDELEKRHDVNYMSKAELECAKAKNEINISDIKKELVAHQETIAIMSQQKEDQTKAYKTREEKELEKVIALENKIKVLDDIIYKTGQSVQTMNMLNRNCKMSFVKPEFLKRAHKANPRLYDIGCYNDNLALMLAPEFDETIRLAQESRSKLSDLIRPFDYKNLNNLYDLFVPQREKSSEQRYFSERSKMSHTPVKNENSKESFNKQTTLLEKRMDESIPWDQKCKSSKELFKIKSSVDTIFDGVERCKQTIAKRTYFGHIDPFIQNTIEGNFCPQIRRINADLEKFHLCLKEEMVADLRYFNSLEHEVDSLKSQLETQKTQFLNEIDRLSREYYYADHMNAILGVYTELDEVTNLQCDYMEALEKCECLEKELSKSKTMSKSFEALQIHAINLELALQQCKEQIKNDKAFKENQSNIFLKEREQYFEIQDLKARLQDKDIAISELKKHVETMKGKSMETKFEKPSVIRQPNAFKSQRSYVLGVIPTTSVSRPLLKRNRIKDRVMPNNSQGKKQEVEYHRRNFKFSNNKTSITACNDSLNAKTSNPIAVPISTKEPKRNVDQSVVTSHKKTVATESTVKKPRIIIRKLYEHVSKTCSWWYPKFTPSGYKWKPKSPIANVNTNVSMPLGNASRTANILEPITPRVYYVEGLNHNLFSVGQFYDADLEVAFRKSKCYIRDLKGNDLLTGSRGTDLYSITLQDTSTPNPICLMAKATLSQAWVWHRRLSHINFDTINFLSKNDIVIGLPKLKFVKDHLCSSCELGKAKQKSFHTMTTPSSKRRLQLLHMDLCGPMLGQITND
ncbi:retrovirus-related pol polyprotein from transposon TNT 1-94 [Tanacetum coccineum]